MEKARDRIASELQGSRESVARLQKRLAPLSSSMDALTPSVDKERKSLIDLTTARNKKVLGGLGLLGLGVGTTALLRRRKKRKQQMAQQQAGGMPKAASAPRKTLRQLIDGSRRGEGHEQRWLPLQITVTLLKKRWITTRTSYGELLRKSRNLWQSLR